VPPLLWQVVPCVCNWYVRNVGSFILHNAVNFGTTVGCVSVRGGSGGGGWVVGDYIRAAHLQSDIRMRYVTDNIVHVSPKRRRILPEYMAPHSRSLSSPFMSVTCFNGKFVSYRRLLGLCSFFMSGLGLWEYMYVET
jgi:hypothetical protein